MSVKDSEQTIEYFYTYRDEYYESVKQLVEKSVLDIEPVDDSPGVTCEQDHDPLEAFSQDQVVIAVDTDSQSVVGLVTYQSGFPAEMNGFLDDYTPCVYLSQIIVHDEYSRSGVLTGLLNEVSSRVSQRYGYFVTRVWSGNRKRLHELVASDFSVALEMNDRRDDIKAYYYVCSIKN